MYYTGTFGHTGGACINIILYTCMLTCQDEDYLWCGPTIHHKIAVSHAWELTVCTQDVEVCWGRGLTLDMLSDCGSGPCTQWGCVGGVALLLTYSQTVGLGHAHSGGVLGVWRHSHALRLWVWHIHTVGGVGGVASLLTYSQTVGLGHAHSGGVLGAWPYS